MKNVYESVKRNSGEKRIAKQNISQNEVILMTKKFVTLEEARKILKVRRATIWLFIKNERLSIVTLACGEYRLKKSEVKKLQTILLRKEEYKQCL
jgi:hypothetical protein